MHVFYYMEQSRRETNTSSVPRCYNVIFDASIIASTAYNCMRHSRFIRITIIIWHVLDATIKV